MNARQRRGAVLILLGLVIAAAVLVAVTAYVREISSQVGPMTTVYTARVPVEAYTSLDAGVLEPVEVPRRWTSPTSQVDLVDLEGRRLAFRVEAGTVITSDMLIPPSDLSPTEREIAIRVDAVTGIAGRVRPGDRVEVYAVFGDVPGLSKEVQVLVRDVRVVSVGGRQSVPDTDLEQGDDTTEEVVVSLALEPADSLAVTYANAFADEVRLVALPTDLGVDRSGDTDQFDADDLGGQAVTEGNDSFVVPEVGP